MDTNWQAVKRDDGCWYVEKGDGYAVLAAIGTPYHEREQVVRLAAMAPKFIEWAASDSFEVEGMGHIYCVFCEQELGNEYDDDDSVHDPSCLHLLARRLLETAAE